MSVGKYLFTTVIAVSSMNSTPPLDMKSVAERVIYALQKRDYSIYRECLVTPEIYNNEVLPAIKNNEYSADSPQYLKLEKNDLYDKDRFDKFNRFFFGELLKKGSQLGIKDWSKVKVVSADVIDSPKINGNKNPVQTWNVSLVYEGQLYKLYAINAIKVPSGYRIITILGLGKGNEN